MRVFTVLGPSHSGKTTLVEALAGLDGRAVKFGLSDTVELTGFSFLGDDWTAIDIAGGPENLAAGGPALAASDAAVLCVPAEAESAVLAAPYLRLIEQSGVPCFLHVNKVDATSERMRDIVAALQAYSSHGLILRQIPMRAGGQVVGAVDLISERAWKYQEGQHSALIELPEELSGREQEARTELLESLADFDDALLEQLIEDKQPATGEVFDLATKVVQHSDLIEVFMGAAREGNGVTRLMKSLRHEVPRYQALVERLGAEGADAIAFAADNKKHVGKMIALRALSGAVKSGEQLGGGNLGNMTELDAKTHLGALEPGQVALVVKSDHLNAGRLIRGPEQEALPDWASGRKPSHERIVAPVNERDDVRLSSALERLSEIDPGLEVKSDKTGQAILSVQGPLHARRLVAKLAEDFGIEVELSNVAPEYRETITKTAETHHRHRKQSGGAGQFADVVIRISPLPRGTGFEFAEEVKGGAVPRNYIPAVASGAGESLREGPHGHPVVDMRIVLLDGKHHAVDSSDFAFRTAGKNAVREALQEIGTQMLQPIMKVEVNVPSVFAGGLVPIVSGLKGQVLGFEAHETAAGWDVFTTMLPAAALEELFRALGSATRGTAWYEAEFDHFQQVSADEVARNEAALNTEDA
jgi:elongation factor G